VAELAGAQAFFADQLGVILHRPVGLCQRLQANGRCGAQVIVDGAERRQPRHCEVQRLQRADAMRERLALAYGHLLAQQRVALAAQIRELQRLLQFHAQRGDVPRLLDVTVNLPLVDCLNRVFDFGVGGGQDAHEVRIALARIAQQLVAEFTGHALVRHEHAQRGGVLVEHALAFFDRGGGDDRRQ
jgi:hypothetical protein